MLEFRLKGVTFFRKHPETGFPFSVGHVGKIDEWFQVYFESDEPSNPIPFSVYTSDVSFFKNFTENCKKEEWEEANPFLKRLKVLSGLGQNRFQSYGEEDIAEGKITRNGDQLSLLEE